MAAVNDSITMARVPAPSELASSIDALDRRLTALATDHEALIRAAGRIERRVAELESTRDELTVSQLLSLLWKRALRMTGRNG